jgi:nitrate reductase beta subunit
VGTFHAHRTRQTSDSLAAPTEPGARVNLLNWDGKGRPPGLFPPPREAPAEPGEITAVGAQPEGRTGAPSSEDLR